MGIQRNAFLAGEGDQWFARNVETIADKTNDPVLRAVDSLGLAPKSILEIGCSNGWRLDRFPSTCAGIDPSEEAIKDGCKRFAAIDLSVGTADSLPFKDAQFDLVIFGFCLYLVDPALHFKCVAEADRVLSDGGSLMIFDFLPPKHYFNDYSHRENMRSHKMEFSKYFLASPAYSLIHREMGVLRGPNEREGVDVLVKDQAGAFQKNPY